MMNKNLSLCINGLIGSLSFSMWTYYITLNQIKQNNMREDRKKDKYKLYIV